MKILSSIVLSSVLISSFAQDCNNPLLDTFGLTGLASPAAGAGLPLCADLQGGQTCCSAETVGQFQNLINQAQQSILATAGQRDQNANNLRNSLLNNYDNAVDDLSDFDDEIRAIQTSTPAVGNELRNQLNLFEDIQTRLDNIDDNDEFGNALRDYQRKRVNCLNTLLLVQASAWCLACNPNYANLGVSADGGITFSNDLNNQIVSSCLPFTESGNNLNSLFQANQSYARVQNLVTYLRAYTSAGNVLPTYNVSDDIEISPIDTQRTNSIPQGCQGNTCTYQTQNLFNNGVLNQAIAANGAGVIGGIDVALPDVGTEPAPASAVSTTPNTGTNVTVVDNTTNADSNVNVVDNTTRLLQSTSTWSPNIAQTGVQLNVLADPGQVTGLQGDGNANNNNGGNVNRSDTDDSDNSAFRLVAGGMTMVAALVGTLMI